MDIKVIIGANWGDEGKGLATDYLCSKYISERKKVLNVLTNGGPQRGHTVDLSTGEHHIFKHFGSGTYAGADICFGPDFMIEPMTFVKEYNELKEKGHLIGTSIYTMTNLVITPYAIMTNQIVERARENKKHGSVGYGIWETIKGNFRINAPCEVRRVLGEAKRFYENELKNYAINEHLDIDKYFQPYADSWNSDGLVEHWIDDYKFYFEHVAKYFNVLYTNSHDVIIAENGQGLLLTGNTPSEVGVKSIENLVKEFYKHGVSTNVESIYVTRTYMTKHGEGRFDEESIINEKYGLIDFNNITNEFQGKLRYGDMDYKSMISRIMHDTLSKSSTSLFITHCNEFVSNQYEIMREAESYGINKFYTSDSKYREGVKFYE